MTMLIESAATYSLVLLQAIIGVVPSNVVVGSSLNKANYYTGGIVTVFSVMAPTVLVARIALTNPNTTVASATIAHISGLQFGSQQRSGSDAEPTPVIEVKGEFSADASSGDIKLRFFSASSNAPIVYQPTNSTRRNRSTTPPKPSPGMVGFDSDACRNFGF
ncbi:hypothetical protein CVT25_004852 [Psilocybe cyanescens]|uniref:Uncharacterized protein n=1 Tax=Psilocybe cyanescens TaxID=93625 RepID=A0A409VZM3_PSICY|nr:hypothetical protein CVT25_004852 [Psilocybe cyanescens]